MKTFRTTRKFMAPPRFTNLDTEGGKVAFALDLIKDAFMRRLVFGLRVRFPQDPIDPTGQTTAPEDALAAMGRDRRVVRGINESAASYAARLVTWLDERQTAGNPFTMMRQLAAYTGASTGCSFRTVDVRGNWYSRDANGVESAVLKTSNWDWDGDTARWSRFWVIIYPGTLWTATTDTWAGGLKWGDPTLVWGFADMTPEHATTLRAIVNDWKPAGTRCQNIIVAFDPASFNPSAPEPDGQWGKWSKIDGGVRVPSRITTARYLAGR